MWLSWLAFLSLVCPVSSIIIQNVVIFDTFKRRVTAIAIILHGQQLLAEQREQLGLRRAAIRASYLRLRPSFVCIISHTHASLRPTASHFSQGSCPIGSQLFVSGLKLAATSMSRLLSVGMILLR